MQDPRPARSRAGCGPAGNAHLQKTERREIIMACEAGLISRREWSQPGSNRRPPPCHGGALPAELWPRERPQCSREIEILGAVHAANLDCYGEVRRGRAAWDGHRFLSWG
jgi:hypothetical protein